MQLDFSRKNFGKQVDTMQQKSWLAHKKRPGSQTEFGWIKFFSYLPKYVTEASESWRHYFLHKMQGFKVVFP